MLLLEIAAQGVKGVAPPGGTARLRPGYNVVAADGAALARLVAAMLHPSPRDADALRTPGSSGALRAGVTLATAGGATYRLVRDFAAGAQLSELDPARRAFTPVPADLADVARVLAERAGAPSPGRLALLTISGAELPSRRAAAAPERPPAPRRPATGGEAVKRIAELKDELARSLRAEKLQYRLDGVQARLFKADEALKEGARLREAVAAAEEALAGAAATAAAADRLGDAEAKLAAHEKAAARRDEALTRTAADRAALDEADAAAAVAPFWKAPLFWAGAGGGLAAAAAGVAGASVGHGLRYLALLDIPAFGWGAWVALRWVSAAEGQGRTVRRRRILDDHERKVTDAWDRETVDVREAVQALGVAGIAELREALQRLAELRAGLADARARVEAHEALPEARAAREERDAAAAELREAEAALAAETGSYVRDPRSVEAELQRVQAEASLPAEAAAPAAAAAPTPPADAFAELLAAAARELGGTAQAAGLAAQARASQILQALSGGRLGPLTVDERAQVGVAQGGRPGPVQALPPQERDVAYLALKLAVVERALAAWQGLAFADDAFQGLPEGSRRVAARVLKQLARPGQLVHATTDPAFREAADHLA